MEILGISKKGSFGGEGKKVMGTYGTLQRPSVEGLHLIDVNVLRRVKRSGERGVEMRGRGRGRDKGRNRGRKTKRLVWRFLRLRPSKELTLSFSGSSGSLSLPLPALSSLPVLVTRVATKRRGICGLRPDAVPEANRLDTTREFMMYDTRLLSTNFVSKQKSENVTRNKVVVTCFKEEVKGSPARNPSRISY